ncbi:hypothetical protein DV737_g137, partial [Chaetothyriales sp. CBS 132003]
MPRKRFDKATSQKYRLLYRSQDDPLIHEEGEHALFPVGRPSDGGAASAKRPLGSGKEGLHIEDLEQDVDLESMRNNEGEAAEHGIYFDDSQYDYMQHLKDLGEGGGSGGGESHFIESVPVKVKGKGKLRLEDALQQLDLEGGSVWGGGGDGFSQFSTATKDRALERQQEVPDEIAGFQPHMDERLREVLEALDDDAYVDEKDEADVFGELGRDGKNGELSLEEFEMTFADDGNDEGWESDVTEKAAVQPKQLEVPRIGQGEGGDGAEGLLDAEAAAAQDGDWLRDFAKFQRDRVKQRPRRSAESIVAGSAVNGQAPTLYTLNGTPLRHKKRKGALTNPSAYSMTSSSLARTEGQQLLDARFDQVEKLYSLDEGDEFDGDLDHDGGMSLASGMTGRSKMSQLSTASFADEGAVRGDFDTIMDGFLGDWNKAHPGGKRRGAQGKRGKNGNEKYGLEQLDEVRRELGRGRVYQKQQQAQKT